MPAPPVPATVLCQVPVADRRARERLTRALRDALARRGAPPRRVVFACIGSDRSTGDALGPLVGERLCDAAVPCEVVGTVERPLHALNLAERLPAGGDGDEAPLVVAVDAALGALPAVGTVALRAGGLRPGEGLGKRLPAVGELAVTATVNVRAGALDAQILQSTRLYLVREMAHLIADACADAIAPVATAALGISSRA
ncbi:MAG: spore protease YyaC [Thermoleophilia bacterium]